MKIVPYWTQEELMGAVWVNSPLCEPLAVSLARLARAIERDGLGRFYSPMTVWFAYREHPELACELEQLKTKRGTRR